MTNPGDLTIEKLSDIVGPFMQERRRVEDILNRVKYRGWKIRLRSAPMAHIEDCEMRMGYAALTITHQVEDSETGETIWLAAQTSLRLMPEYPEEYYLKAIMEAINERERHEAAEFFIVDGKKPFHPHRFEGKP